MGSVNDDLRLFNPFEDDLELNTFRKLVNESNDFYGVPVFYLIRETDTVDSLYGEDPLAVVGTEHYKMRMYLETFEKWDSSGDIFTKFGLNISDEAILHIGIDYFDEYTKRSTTLNGRPRIGDILYFQWAKMYFEITFVDDEEPFFHLGNLAGYKVKAKLWEYSHEQMDTNIEEIDNIEPVNSTGDVVIDAYSDNETIDIENDDVLNDDETNPMGNVD